MKNPSTFENARRVNFSMTASAERKLLIWMAERLPGWVTPDYLTAMALAAQIAAGVDYALCHWNTAFLWLVNLSLVVNWLGDSLDGTLARVRSRQRPRYGFYVDHMVDTLGALALMLGLACSGLLHWQVAMGLLVCFYVLAIESYLATYTLGDFYLAHSFFGPTEVRILLIIGNSIVAIRPYEQINGFTFRLFDAGGMVAILAMVILALVTAVRNTVVLHREERLS